MPNLRMYARGRPQTPHRWCSWVENRGGRSDFAISDFLAISILPEGHTQTREQGLPLLVCAGGGHDGHLQPAQFIDLVVVDLGKHQLLAQAERVIAMAVERLGFDAAKVTNARQGDIQQLVQELVHAAPAQGYLGADG